jgi:hypothetical protein
MRGWAIGFLLGALALTYYAALITDGTGNLFGFEIHGYTFNSMLLQLLHGQLDVDARTIGVEGFLRNGRTYAYFGIFPALVRLPMLPFLDLASTCVARVSCLFAIATLVFFSVMSILTIHRSLPATFANRLLTAGLLSVTLLAGPAIQQNAARIWFEPLLWAGALSSAFIFCLTKRFVAGGRPTDHELALLSLIAGLTLLTRVTMALPLLAIVGYLLIERALTARRGERRHPLAAWTLLLGLIAAAGVINYQRWGDPFVFVDLRLQLLNLRSPDRLPRFEQYGAFHWMRAWFGVVYYFLPIWPLKADGEYIFHGFVSKYLDFAEAPPSSFLITDPLLLALVVPGIRAAFSRGKSASGTRDRFAVACVIAFAIPCLLMLSAIAMSHRYRLEFYPFFLWAALLGYRRVGAGTTFGAATAVRKRLLAGGVALLVLIGVVSSHLVLGMMRTSSLGPATAKTRLGDPLYLLHARRSVPAASVGAATPDESTRESVRPR